VVDETVAHERDRLEAAVGVLGEPGDDEAVVHAPAVLAGEVHADLAVVDRYGGRQHVVAGGVGVVR
jgi:hypothetical protein